MNNRKEYAYILCVDGEIKHLIAKWWNTPMEMFGNMSAMHAAACVFRKTAAILVYEYKDHMKWTFVNHCQWRGGYFPKEITITSDNRMCYK